MARSTRTSSGRIGASARSAASRSQNALSFVGVLGIDLLEPLRLGELVLALLFAAEADRQSRPDVASSRRGAEEPERVGRDPDGGAGKRAEEHLVVERVGDHAEEAQEVLDLLLRPVAAPAHHVRLEAEAPQRLLVCVHVGEGAKQHDDVAALHVLVDPPAARSRSASARACATIAGLVSDCGSFISSSWSFHFRCFAPVPS